MSAPAEVRLWGRRIGAVFLGEGDDAAVFEYEPAFVGSGIEVSPISMPLQVGPYLRFPRCHGIPFTACRGCWRIRCRTGRQRADRRVAGDARADAGEFQCGGAAVLHRRPRHGRAGVCAGAGPEPRTATRIEIDALVRLAGEVLTHRGDLQASFHGAGKEKALRDILRVGTSAGGARAKAVIAWNRATNEVRSGQIAAGEGFDYWLLKFDGVAGNKDKELEDPKGYGAIEYAYHLMAKAAGITMTECRLLEENGRRHFMTAASIAWRAGRSCTCSRSARWRISISTRPAPTPTSRRC